MRPEVTVSHTRGEEGHGGGVLRARIGRRRGPGQPSRYAGTGTNGLSRLATQARGATDRTIPRSRLRRLCARTPTWLPEDDRVAEAPLSRRPLVTSLLPRVPIPPRARLSGVARPSRCMQASRSSAATYRLPGRRWDTGLPFLAAPGDADGLAEAIVRSPRSGSPRACRASECRADPVAAVGGGDVGGVCRAPRGCPGRGAPRPDVEGRWPADNEALATRMKAGDDAPRRRRGGQVAGTGAPPVRSRRRDRHGGRGSQRLSENSVRREIVRFPGD